MSAPALELLTFAVECTALPLAFVAAWGLFKALIS